MKKICFVGLDNYPVLNPEYGDKKIGGESVQQTLIAREFARQGYETSMLVKDYGQPDNEVIDGIRCLKTFVEGAGLPVVKFIYPKAYRIWKALSEADADVYYQSCASFITGLTKYYAQSHGKSFVYRVAHDTDCMPGQQLIRYYRDKKIYDYGLKGASIVFAQSVKQADLLRNNYGIESPVVNMLVESPPAAEAELDKDIDILWVNNIRPFKRPDLLLEVARKSPQFRIVMCGGAGVECRDYYEDIERQAGAIENLDFLGAVPYAEVGKLFSRAKMFVNTSDSEGFPNTFLQAWVRGMPVISFFDPDGVIERKHLGVNPSSVDDMVKVLTTMSAENSMKDYSADALGYIEENHSSSAIVGEYIRFFEENNL